jgi:hypothetical protein
LIGQRRLKLLHFLGHKTQAAMHVHDLLRELPVNTVDLCFRLELEQAKGERLLRLLLDLLDVVQTLEPVPALEPLLHIKNVADELVIVFADVDFKLGRRFLDGTEGLDHENRMVGHDRAPAFVHDRRMRDAFGIADVHDVPNHVVSVFLK